MADPQIEIIIGGLDRVTERVVKKITLDVTANLISTTPIDTGWARSNWVPSIGGPETRTAGSPGAVSSAAQQSGIAQVAATYRIEQGRVFVSNNVPYITRLNAGTSLQAPAGFVEAAVEKAVSTDLGAFR